MVAPDLIGIDVEVHELLARAQPEALEPRAHRQHHVGGVEQRAQPAVHPHRADRQRVAVVDRALALARGEHRRLERAPPPPRAPRSRRRARRRRRRRSAARSAPASSAAASLSDGVGRCGRLRSRPAARSRRRSGRRTSRAGSRPRPGAVRPVSMWRKPVRTASGICPASRTRCGPLGDRAHEVELVVHVVQQPEVVADAGAVHLAREQQHGRRARERGREARAGVVDADARHHHGDTGTAADAGVARRPCRWCACSWRVTM